MILIEMSKKNFFFESQYNNLFYVAPIKIMWS